MKFPDFLGVGGIIFPIQFSKSVFVSNPLLLCSLSYSPHGLDVVSLPGNGDEESSLRRGIAFPKPFYFPYSTPGTDTLFL